MLPCMSATCGGGKNSGNVAEECHVYTFEDQQPSLLIMWTGMPTATAVIEAPILKLYPAYNNGFRPALDGT